MALSHVDEEKLLQRIKEQISCNFGIKKLQHINFLDLLFFISIVKLSPSGCLLRYI